jgi:hypothetical protein
MGVNDHIPPNAINIIKIITTIGAIDSLFFIPFIKKASLGERFPCPRGTTDNSPVIYREA